MATISHRLDFERPIYELEARLHKLETSSGDNLAVREDIRRLKRELAETTAALVAARFEAAVIEYEGEPITIIAHWGVAEIGPASATDAIRHAADADQRARASGAGGDPHASGEADAGSDTGEAGRAAK